MMLPQLSSQFIKNVFIVNKAHNENSSRHNTSLNWGKTRHNYYLGIVHRNIFAMCINTLVKGTPAPVCCSMTKKRSAGVLLKLRRAGDEPALCARGVQYVGIRENGVEPQGH